jgi:hypothetical protein
MQDERITKTTEALGALQKEWGEAFGDKAQKALVAVQKFGGTELMGVLEQTGLGDHPALIKAFEQVASLLREDDLPGGLGRSTKMSPVEAKTKIAQTLGDGSHPFHISGHPGNKAAIEEMSKLYAIAYPDESV